MNNFKKLNIIIGWASFLIAATVYILTLEPTVSLWDCGEFIASAYKLQVGHPPGAPLFLIIARVFSLFASDVENVANDKWSFCVCKCIYHSFSFLDHITFVKKDIYQI